MGPRVEDVTAVLQAYFDGLYESDAGKLASVFHSGAVYACATEAPFVRLTMEDYLPMVAARPSPASRNENRRDEILSIDFAGPNTAFAKVRCAIGPKHFTDFLTLVRTEEAWRIIAKVFHYDLEPAT